MRTTITPVPRAARAAGDGVAKTGVAKTGTARTGTARTGTAGGGIVRRGIVSGGPARYTVLLVGLGAAGVAIGWLGPQVAASSAAVIRRR
ncbi:hypothetical protein [Spirillospora sp. NPDC029432]|uniref:hypothetical protein n=1 Tax=Spirillospora sp. NPDC029432 TaxID=3154599 RepID=UPI0034535C6D